MIGFGYDVHRLAPGETLVLGGVPIPSPVGTIAHSDGDVVLHALCDALLGAAGLGDIGEHFPDSDATWKNAPSSVFVTNVCSLLNHHGFGIVNVDITLVLEAPKILPYKQRMREIVSSLLSLPINRVNIKATTSEKVGFVGRGEGAECYCICMLRELV